jgi:hypothetical protein
VAKEENLNPESVFPWGKKTGTYKALVTLFAINAIVLSLAFLVQVEIPTILGEKDILGIPSGEMIGLGDIVIHWYWICIFVATFNIAITFILIRIGRWVWSIKHLCTSRGCYTWIAISWVIWIITIISIITTVMLWLLCWWT